MYTWFSLEEYCVLIIIFKVNIEKDFDKPYYA
jgi:hypothetical protein